MNLIRLLRIKDWAKNCFLFIPIFFAGEIRNTEKILAILPGCLCFCLVASSIYIINDYRDIEDDRKHPEKSKRPLASGAVSKPMALVTLAVLLIAGFTIAALLRDKFLVILAIYFVLNLGYSFGLKTIPILDIMIVSAGFMLRVKGGSALSYTVLSEWLNIMVFLLALFMAVGKRRDDVLLKLSSGTDMRKAVKGYNLEYLNTMIALICSVVVVAYFMYTMSPDIIKQYQSSRLYYTCIFILAGIMRYMQIIFVQGKSGSPTKILYKDRFIQVCILLWIASFYLILYVKDVTFFK